MGAIIMANRRVYYYKINIFDRYTQNNLTHNANNIFNEIFRLNCVNANGVNSLTLDQGEHNVDRITMDIIRRDANHLFARVGKTKDINEALIRDIRTNEINTVVDVADNEHKKLEIFTYFMLDYTTGILGFIEGQAAPNVINLINITSRYSDIYTMEIENIVSNETVRALLTPGSIISKLNYNFRVPTVEILEELNMPREVIDVLTDTDLTQARLVLRNDPRKHLTSEQNIIGRLIDAIQNNPLDVSDEISLIGRTVNSSLQEYSFDIQNFSTTVDIATSHIVDGILSTYTLAEVADEAFARMSLAYNNQKNNIINLGNIE
jgi:hypothetical protein